MALRDIVDVQITRQTASITRQGFGTLAFVYEKNTVPSARVLSFGSADEVADSNDLTETAKAALAAAFTGDMNPSRVKAIYKLSGQPDADDDESYSDALSAAQAVDEDWYCVAIESRVDTDILGVAAWVESRYKIFIAATNDPNILNPTNATDAASVLLAGSYSRTAMIYSATAVGQWPDVAWAGSMLPNDPGSVTWAFKRVRGVTGQVFTASQITALEAKRVSRVEIIQGLASSVGGYTSEQGAFIDIIRGLDWLRQTMAEDIFILLANTPKVPYTNQGVAQVETVIRARLQVAINRNVLVDDENLSISTPDVADTDPNDRANRVLRDVSFTARLAGAVHRVMVRGTVSV
ncbi:MAG: hypothetical protein DI556_09795 [Rhodovulum sulfidophilum]|uniref:DUF3383 family protein n=1 Tax=Rhodovulum sulfidophilum TaxID=35806 RepID=A0A2W5N9Q4_RHOSU|nr:MAG: hypothetical protein DI556_09795 [Rhodovulum sulfidophilum]